MPEVAYDAERQCYVSVEQLRRRAAEGMTFVA